MSITFEEQEVDAMLYESRESMRVDIDAGIDELTDAAESLAGYDRACHHPNRSMDYHAGYEEALRRVKDHLEEKLKEV